MFVLITDVKKSRDIENRVKFSTQLQDVLVDLNHKFEKDLCAGISSSKGIDELSAVLEVVDIFPRVCLSLQIKLHEVNLRFAIAEGELDVRPAGEVASSWDGPAFHTAAEIMEQVEKMKMSFGCKIRRDEGQELITHLMEFCLLTVQGWPTKTARVAEYAWFHTDLTQDQIADDLGLTQQSVSFSLKRSRLSLIVRSVNSMEMWLKSHDNFSY